MSALQLRIIKRAVKNRMVDGETFEDIILDYPKLTNAEIEKIKSELGLE